MNPNSDQILVIDPSNEDRERLVSYLSRKGYFVVSASSIEHASLMVFEQAPDLVFADVQSEQIELIPFIGGGSKKASLIIVSHAEWAGDIVACLRAGADDFILKPVDDFDTLDRVINKTLDKIRLAKLNKRLRNELEDGNRKLREGIHALRVDQKAGLQVQLKMLPESNQTLNGFVFNHVIRPSLYLSGDFLDYFRIDDNRTMLYFADVSGHGASSAFVTVLLKNLTVRLMRNFKRNSSDEITCPVRFVQRINSELIVSDLGKHITVFAGIIDTTTRELSYTVGGHLPLPILSTDNGESEYLSAKGVAVGLFPGPKFELKHQTLPPGFRLTLFSDGILELIGGGSLKDKEKLLLDVVSEELGDIESLLTSLGLDGIDELPDDIAVLTVCDQDRSQL
jgi:sigma-B regulation protein RsbU (phosphoserine phosphatase)